MSSSELERIRRVYEQYDADEARTARYDEPRNLGMVVERWRVIARLLEQAGGVSLCDQRVLELGCGRGDNVDWLLALGADPHLLVGADLLPDRTAAARGLYPDIAFACADGTSLPFPEGTFDVVLLFTVISSILDGAVSRAVAADVARVLRPAGAVVWYDLRVDNPRNRHVRGVDRRELVNLFPGFRLCGRSLTLAPPLARRLGSAFGWAYPILAALPPLRTHYAAVLRRTDFGEVSSPSNREG
jgi:SAM-dependent methyltransferase